jgi:DHA3 family tetracycline resistance protein-like MFS transporter
LENFTLPLGESLQPVAWIGMMRAVGMVLSIGAAELARRRVRLDDRVDIARAMMVISSALFAGLLGFALAPWLGVVLLAYWLVYVMRNVIAPIYEAWVNQGLDSQVRATVLSMSSQVDAIGQIAGGPVVGWIGNLFSVRAALLASSLVFSPALLLIRRVIRLGPAPSSGQPPER